MRQIFLILLFLKALRVLLPWIAGLVCSLVLVSLAPFPPFVTLLVIVIVTVAIAQELETSFFRKFERTNPRSYGLDIPTRTGRASRSRRR